MGVSARAMDGVYGRPAAGVPACLERISDDTWEPVARVETDVAIYAIARPLLGRLRAERRTGARLLGVAASNLEAARTQMTLFDVEARVLETERDRRLAHAADEVRRRFGRDALAPGDLLERSPDAD